MSVKFITAIYSRLAGSDLGGRHARGGHYRYSLLSLLKMTNADFICYTTEDFREYEYRPSLTSDAITYSTDTGVTYDSFKRQC